MKNTQWNILRNLINSKNIGDTITRQELMKLIYKTPKVWRSYSAGTPVDRYRRCLSMIGILTIIDRGVYRIDHHIKSDVSIGKITEAAYSWNWQQWFNDFKKG